MTREPRPAIDREGPWILVVDVGSSSARAWLFDCAGNGLDAGPDAQRAYAPRAGPEGAMEYAPVVLLDAVVAVIDAALARAREARLEIRAIASAGFWHSLLGLDAAGAPLTPVLAWGDTRAGRTALDLRERVDEGAYHRRTGCFLHPSYPAVRLAWLRRSDPDAFGRVASWVSFAEYAEERLFGHRACSVSMASGTGLLDVHRLEWDDEALAMAGIGRERLSPLADGEAPPPGMRPEFARRWPELARAAWFPALGDGACSNVGSGAVGTARIGVTVGTTAAARALWEPAGEVAVPDRLWCYRLDGRRWVAGGALSNGGNAVAYLRGLLALPDEREWLASVAEMEPDAHGLTVLPFLVGERGPGWLDETRAAVFGMRAATTPAELVRAWMEAVAYRVAGVCTRLEAVLRAEPQVIASGGALHASPVWAQIMADVLGRTVQLPVEREATARGAALVALERLGEIGNACEPPADAAVRFDPDPARVRRYRAAMRRQEELHSALAPWLAIPSPSTDGETH